MSQNGKGCKRRPPSVDHQTYADNWDRIFQQPKQHKALHPDPEWLKKPHEYLANITERSLQAMRDFVPTDIDEDA